ncbi:hypothetical protein KSX_86320 [Ktedonospora formicarum]|uniref:Uncharacterized protein n=1 Tax=Ktedonospora formicarum TaxID=2778364 RepID=A0A8J3IFZ8_9CHLR|nr:hypothetical protein KSX_86320 [Ktedonospora formicarum]
MGPIQRDLYSAFLAAYLDPADTHPSCARYQPYWEGAEARLRAAHECLIQRAREGQVLPQSLGVIRARARLPESSGELSEFSLRDHRLGATIVGMSRPVRIEETFAFAELSIPQAFFWRELEALL